MTIPAGRLLADYTRWHHLQVTTGDIDPTYPVLRHLTASLSLTRDQAAWLVLLHVTYYHAGSALAAYTGHPHPGPPDPHVLRLPTGTERRGHRDPVKLRRHWLALLDAFDQHGGPWAWITAAGLGWHAINRHVASVHGNGRWAAYKTAELAQKVLALPTVVADAGHANSSGPRHGLALLVPDLPTGNRPADIAALDRATTALARHLAEPDMGQVETSLCDFHSLTAGRYYLGHDIDAMQRQLLRVRSDLTAAAFDARAATLPAAYLGEQNGRAGVDQARRGVYTRTGVICER